MDFIGQAIAEHARSMFSHSGSETRAYSFKEVETLLTLPLPVSSAYLALIDDAEYVSESEGFRVPALPEWHDMYAAALSDPRALTHPKTLEADGNTFSVGQRVKGTEWSVNTQLTGNLVEITVEPLGDGYCDATLWVVWDGTTGSSPHGIQDVEIAE